MNTSATIRIERPTSAVRAAKIERYLRALRERGGDVGAKVLCDLAGSERLLGQGRLAMAEDDCSLVDPEPVAARWSVTARRISC